MQIAIESELGFYEKGELTIDRKSLLAYCEGDKGGATMGVKTEIHWCDSTVNPTSGCDGCELWNKLRKKCYAGLITQRFGGTNKGLSPKFEILTTYPGRMREAAFWSDLTGTNRPDKPWLNGLPRLIFVSDMSDALSKDVTFDYLEEEIIDYALAPHHYLWLTKRPERMAEFSEWLAEKGIEWPDNLWAGTSITTQSTLPRIDSLLKVGTKDTIRFLSVEPQWEEINLTPWLDRLNWVIQGGESGAGATKFDINWAFSLVEQCQAHRVPYFLKQLGTRVFEGEERLKLESWTGSDWSEWPKRIKVRQFPIDAAA